MTSLVQLVDALAWPLTILAIVVLFRREVQAIASRLSRLRYKEFEATFEKGLQEAEARAKAVVLAMPESEPTPIPPENELLAEERLSRLVEISPRAAISEAWIGVEEAVGEVARRLNLESSGRMSAHRIVQQLRGLGQINDDVSAAYDHLRSLRNEAVHTSEFALSAEDTSRYVELAKGLAAYLLFRVRPQVEDE